MELPLAEVIKVVDDEARLLDDDEENDDDDDVIAVTDEVWVTKVFVMMAGAEGIVGVIDAVVGRPSEM